MIVDLLRLDLRFELLLNLEQVIARALSFEGTATGMYFGEPTVPRSRARYDCDRQGRRTRSVSDHPGACPHLSIAIVHQFPALQRGRVHFLTQSTSYTAAVTAWTGS